MKPNSFFAAAVLASLLLTSAPGSAQAAGERGRSGSRTQAMANFEKTDERNGVSRYVMKSNGMDVLIKEDHSAPVVTFMVHYRVGSRNEAVGHTGSTHLLEHMLFKGTPTFNRDKGTQIAAQLERVGADWNATTWLDRTNYFETVPSDQLEFAVRLEADRMRNSFINDADRQSEMTVVRNELERGENDPINVLDTQSFATAYREHPYHHPTIGWRTDVEGVPTARLKAFYDTFYWPNNATAIVVGDFKTDEALALVDRHFGKIPRSPQPIPEVYTEEPEQQGERRFVVRRAGQDGIVMLNFRSPGAAHPDTPVLTIISTLLTTGRSSRLYLSLVDKQLTSSISGYASLFRDPALFQIYGRLMPGVTHERVEAEILAGLQRLRDEPVPADEIEKAKRIVGTNIVFSREGSYSYVREMSEAIAGADWTWFFTYPEAVKKVTAEDVQRVAKTYFRPSQMTAGWFIPTGKDGDEDDFKTASVAHRPATYIPEGEDGESPAAGGSLVEPPARAGAQSGTSFAARTLRKELAGGSTVLALENHADPTVAIKAQIRAGSYYAPADSRVLADVTARMLQRGTQKRDALRFAQDVESLGAQLNVASGAFAVEVDARALSRDVKTILQAMAEMLREPAFAPAELVKVKAEIAAEIRQGQDSTSSRAFDRLTQIVLTPTSPYYQPEAEVQLSTLDKITIDDVKRYYQARFSGPAATIAIVGDVDAKDVVAEAGRLFGDWKGSKPGDVTAEVVQPKAGGRETVIVKDKANADVIIGQPGTLRRRDPDFLAAAIGNAVLGQSALSSRFGLRVRDREGLTYGIGSRFYGASLTDGLFYIQVTVQPGNIDKAIASTLDELNRALREGVTQAEVEDYKSNFIGSFKVSLSTNAGIAQRLIEAELFGYGPRYLDDYPALVSAVTLADVNAALRKHILPARLAIVVAGDIPEKK